MLVKIAGTLVLGTTCLSFLYHDLFFGIWSSDLTSIHGKSGFEWLFQNLAHFRASSEFELSRVLYMSFDRFLLAVESRDLSQADKSVFFPKAE